MIRLIGILILVAGLALGLNSILVIFVSMIATAMAGGLGIGEFLEVLGSSFVGNRSMIIFVIIMFVTGTLERNGLKESAAKLIAKFRNATAGAIISIYGVMRMIFAAFNVSFGGVAGIVKPVVMPMTEGAVKVKEGRVDQDHMEEIKGMAAGMENISWFFGQVLFVGGAGGLLVQNTLADLGYQVELVDLALVQIPVAITALIVSIVYYNLKDRYLTDKLY